MTEPLVYIGFLEYTENGEVFVDIILSPYPEAFTGEYYPITADYGEGSCGNLFFKLKNNLEKNVRRLKNQNGRHLMSDL